MRILIDVPSYEHIENETFKSIYDLDTCGHEVEFRYTVGYGVAMARNRMGMHAQEGKFDAILMVDNDVVLPRDALANLLEHDVDVCMGYYRHRWAPDDDVTCLFKPGQKWDSRYTCAELSAKRRDGIHKIRVKGGGMGCALIKTCALDYLPYPWFEWTDHDDRSGSLGEDIDFCIKCEMFGLPVYADTRVACGHAARRILEAG